MPQPTALPRAHGCVPRVHKVRVHSTHSSGGWYKAGAEDTHFFHSPLYITVLLSSHCRLCSRVREIPTRMMIPQKTE